MRFSHDEGRINSEKKKSVQKYQEKDEEKCFPAWAPGLPASKCPQAPGACLCPKTTKGAYGRFLLRICRPGKHSAPGGGGTGRGAGGAAAREASGSGRLAGRCGMRRGGRPGSERGRGRESRSGA